MRKGKILNSITSLIDDLATDINHRKKVSDILPLINELFHAEFSAFYKRNKISNDFEITKTIPYSANNKFETENSKSILYEKFTKGEVKKRPYMQQYFFRFLTRVTHTDIAIPVYYDELYHINKSVLGIIIIRKKGRLGKKDAAILELLNKVISIFNSKNLLLKRFEEALSNHLQIANVKDHNLDNLYDNFLKRMYKLMSAKFISLWLYNQLDDTLALRSFYPFEIEGQPISFSSFDNRILDCKKHLTGQALKEKVPKVFTDIQNSENFANSKFAKQHNLSWFIVFPILINSASSAALIVCPECQETGISETELDNLNKFVSELSNVIRLSNLFFEEDLLADYDDFLKIMLEFQDERKFWDDLAHLIKSKMNCEACSIFLLNSSNNLHLKGSTGIEGAAKYSQVFYFPGEGLTYKAFQQDEPLIYYPEMIQKYEGVHKSKFREVLPENGRSKSLIFMKIYDENQRPIGIIRCNNKIETPARHIGKFTNEDVWHLKKISHVISNIYAKASAITEKEQIRERNLNSLHHELLAPLDGIQSHIEWFERYYFQHDSEIQRKALIKFDDIKQNGKLIDMLVASLGNFDQINLTISEFQLPTKLRLTRSFISNEAFARNIKIAIGFVESKIEGDEFLLLRVFYNLLRNAVKYYDRSEPLRKVEIKSDAINDKILLFFSDNGIGIPVGEEEIIFRKFSRGSNSRKVYPEGTGLGLSFCKSIIEKHNGTIKVSRNAKPTVFEIMLPRKIKMT